MVAIFTGGGTGLQRGSAGVLGAAGLLGTAASGRGGEQLMLNAATGNLVIARQDEFLVGRGPDATIARTYNSQGDLSDDNGDNWRFGTDRRVWGLEGGLNAAGSSVLRTAEDGSVAVYRWSGSAYVTADGGGAHDRLTYDGTWRWTDGDTGTVESYGHDVGGGSWRVTEQRDTSGNTLTYGYDAEHRVASIRTADGGTVRYAWAGRNVVEIVTGYTDLASGAARASIRTRYGYDALDRLVTVTTDLSPDDASITDGNSYTTSYAYHATSRLVATVAGTDGGRTSFAYDGQSRVVAVTEAVAGDETRTVSIAYGAGFTNVTDAAGQVTTLEYDGDGALRTIVAPPAAAGAARQVTRFTYTAAGDVESVTDGAGAVTRHAYDDRGNAVATLDPDGTVTVRTFSATNRLLTEIRDANRLRNPDFAAGAAGWFVAYNPHGIATSGAYAGSHAGKSYVRMNYQAGSEEQIVSLSTGDDAFFGVVGGERLWVEAGLEGQGPVRRQQLVVHWFDAAGNYAGQSEVGVRQGGLPYDTKVGGFIDVPTNAARARLEVYLTTAGAGAGTLLMVEPTIVRAAPGQTARASFGAVVGGGVPATTRYVYDGADRLRYVVDAEGGVTEHRYDGYGRAEWRIAYPDARYPAGGTGAPSEGEVDAWRNALDRRNAEMVRTVWDARGNVAEEIRYAAADAAGNPNTASGYARTLFQYDQAGQLVSRSVVGPAAVQSPVEGFSRYLLEPGRRGGVEAIAKTYRLNPAVARTAMDADLLKLDTWDGEALIVFVNGAEAFRFSPKSNAVGADGGAGSFAIGGLAGTWSITSSGTDGFFGGQAPWTDRAYRLHLDLVGAGASVKLGLGTTLDEDVNNEALGIDNVTVTQDAQVDDFEDGAAAGWTLNGAPAPVMAAVSGAAAGLSRALGPVGGSGGGEALSKTYALNASQSKTTAEFDFTKLDSWDGEHLIVYLNGGAAFSFAPRAYGGAGADNASGSFVANGIRGTWTLTALGEEAFVAGAPQWHERRYRVGIALEGAGAALRLGFGATLDEDVGNESFVIDNVRIGQPPLVDDFEDGGAAGWAVQTAGAPVTIGDGGLGGYLGKFDRITGPGGAQAIAKTFALDPRLGGTVAEFDFLKIDSWDGEELLVYLDNQVAFRFSPGQYGAGVAGGGGGFAVGGLTGSWSITSGGADQHLGGWNAFADRGYRVRIEIAGAGSALTLGFGSTLDQTADDEALGIDNVRVGQFADSLDRFDDGRSAGWTLPGGGLAPVAGGVLGRFGGSAGAEAVAKTFALNPIYERTSLDVDFTKLNSWDGEQFVIHLDGVAAITFTPSFYDGAGGSQGAAGSFAIGGRRGTYTITSTGRDDIASDYPGMADNRLWAGRSYHAHLEIDGGGGAVRLGFGSTLDESAANESFTIDNVRLVQRRGDGLDDFENGAANGWTWPNGTPAPVAGPSVALQGGFSRHLGDFGTTGGGEAVFKTFALDPTLGRTVAEFDLLKIDSWDGETFRVFLDGGIALEFQPRFYAGGLDGTAGSFLLGNLRGSYSITSTGVDQSPGDHPSWSERAYRVRLEIDGAGGAVRLGFGSTLDQGAADEAFGIDNVRVRQLRSGAVETFENGSAAGWTLASGGAAAVSGPTAAIDGGFSAAMGRFGGSGGAEAVFRTLPLASATSRATLEFDFLKIDSWDGESLVVHLDGRPAFSFAPEGCGGGADAGSGSFALGGLRGSWAVTSSGEDQSPGAATWWGERTYRVRIDLEGTGASLRLGFGATLDEGAANESYAIDNLTLRQPIADDFDDGRAGGWYVPGLAPPVAGAPRAGVALPLPERETFVYDGLGRLIASTDRGGGATRILFDDARSRTVMSFSTGLTRTSTFDRAGQLVAVTEAGAFVAGGTATTTYDRAGLPRMLTDASGNRSYTLHDRLGRRVADVAHGGQVVEYRYDAADRLVATVHYADGASAAQLSLLADANAVVDVASIRPRADDTDIWAWTVYDAGGRVAGTIDGTGAVVEFGYDADDAPVFTRAYANRLSAGELSAFRAAAPATLSRPPASGADVVVRSFRDRDGRLVGTLDGEGYLTRATYDAAGRKVLEVVAANPTAGHLRAAGSFAELAGSVGTSGADRRHRWAYDGQGHLRFEVDADDRVTEYRYDAGERLSVDDKPWQVLRYAGRIPELAAYTVGTVADAVAAGGLAGDGRGTVAIHDAAGRLAYAIDAEGGVVGYTYDVAGRVVRTVAYANRLPLTSPPRKLDLDGWTGANRHPADRITRHYYDARGGERFTVDAEGYVTAREFDSEGRAIRELRWGAAIAVDDATSAEAVAARVGGAAVERRFAYDARGQLVETTDGEGNRTRHLYNGTGTLLYGIAAWGTADQSQTWYQYDNAGRLVRTTVALGTPDQASTSVAYDGRGNPMSRTDAAGRVTSFAYDRAGQLVSETDAAGGVTSYGYDGLGDRVRVTDARGSQTWSYFDRLGRVVAVRDAENYVTETAYTAFGEVASVTRRANQSWTGIGPEWPHVTAHPADATTRFSYDRLGRVTIGWDAEGYAEQRWYDAFGGTVQEQNKVGGVTRRVFDRRGLMVAETMPGGSFNEWGNRLSGDADITRFDPVYYARAYGDLAPMAHDQAWLTWHWQNHGWRERRNPNAFFNTGDYLDTYADVAAAGVNPLEHYVIAGIREGRRPAKAPGSPDPSLTGGITSRFEYDARGNLTRKVEASGLPEQRTTRFAYDRADRLVETRGDAVQWVDQGGYNVQGPTEPVERRRYDARGNLVELTDARGARTLFFYDKQDRKTEQVDALGAIVSWRYDAVGNLVHERRWALRTPNPGAAQHPGVTAEDRVTDNAYDALNRLKTSTVRGVRTGQWNGSYYETGVTDVTTAYDYDANGNVLRVIDGAGGMTYATFDRLGRRTRQVDAEGFITGWLYDAEGNVRHERRWAQRSPGYGVGWIADPGVSGEDRVTDFGHDRMGRRVSETRRGVAAYAVGATGALGQVSSDATVSYQYNGLGRVVRRTEATGEATAYEYDAAGRLAHETRAGYFDQDGEWTQPLLSYRYNGLGDLSRTEQTRQGGGETRVTRYGYSAGGRLHTTTDAAGTVFTHWQDVAGAEVIRTWNRNRADGAVSHEGVMYVRDVLGRVTSQATGWHDGQWNRGDAQETRYNGFGEVSERGINGLQEQLGYDNGGRLVRTNSGDGVWRYFVSDGAGRRTLTLENQGRGALVARGIDDALHIASTGSQTPIDQAYVAGVAATVAVYDRRGQQVATRLPNRELGGGRVQSLELAAGYTPFGELAWERDATGATTSYGYNTMGRRTSVQRAAVLVTDEAGNTSWTNPTDHLFYDAGGRLVGQRDANGAVTTRHLLAGTGYGATEASVTAEFHPDGGTARFAYDRFGDRRRAVDEIDRATTMNYDALGRLVQQIRPSGRSDSYAYDVLGQRIRHWNDALGYDDAEITDYDHQGRVTSTRAFGGDATTTSYRWEGGAAAAGLGVPGSWVEVTVQANGLSTAEQSDLFGHTIAATDLDGTQTLFTYDHGGRMLTRSGRGETVSFAWHNTGLLAAQSSDLGSGYTRATATFGYDAAGRRTEESYARDWVQYTQSSATYDALGRMIWWHQADTALPAATMSWSYDANGNIRRTQADKAVLGGDGQVYYRTPEDRWFRYDAMNRVTLDGGQLAGGQIVRGWTGASLTYDAAGQRTDSVRDAWLTGTVHAWENQPGNYYNDYYYDDPDRGRWVEREASYQGVSAEHYSYTVDGQLAAVAIAQTGYEDNWDGTATPTDTLDRSGGSAAFEYDTIGRQTRQIDRNAAGQTVYDRQQSLDAAGRTGWEQVTSRQGNDTVTTSTTNYYDWNGSALGAVKHSSSYTTRNGQGQGGTEVDHGYYFMNGGAQIAWTQTSGQTSSYTSYNYGAGGRLDTIGISDGRSRTVTVASDLNGQALARDEQDNNGNAGDPHERWYRFNGNELGHVGNDPTWAGDYAGSIRTRGYAPNNAALGNNRRYTGEFAESIDRITSYEQGSGGGSYTVRAGDTLAGIAAQVWGDAALWYKLASANGLQASSQLIPGQSLTLPAGVTRSTYNAAQLRPFDPADAIGDTSPVSAQPTAKAKKNKCGTFGKILLVAVAVAVTIATSGAAVAALSPTVGSIGAGIGTVLGLSGAATVGAGTLVAAGIAGGIVGSVVSQGVGLATGIQDKFSWKGVALAGLSGAIGGGIGASGIGGAGAPGAVLRGALGSAATQGAAIATGLQSKFDFAAVAVAGVVGGVGQAIGGNSTSFWRQTAAGAASALAGAAARSLVTGTSFGDNILAVLPDVIGTTVGRLAARAVASGGNGPATVAAEPIDRQKDGGLVNEDALRVDPDDPAFALTGSGLAQSGMLGTDVTDLPFGGPPMLMAMQGSIPIVISPDKPTSIAEARARLNKNLDIIARADATPKAKAEAKAKVEQAYAPYLQQSAYASPSPIRDAIVADVGDLLQYARNAPGGELFSHHLDDLGATIDLSGHLPGQVGTAAKVGLAIGGAAAVGVGYLNTPATPPSDKLPPFVYGSFTVDTHKNMPVPRFGRESHHGVMSAWMKNHFSNYDQDLAPAVLMPTANHNATRGVYNSWRAEQRVAMGGTFDWGRVSETSARRLSERMFDAARAPDPVRNEYWKRFDLIKRNLLR